MGFKLFQSMWLFPLLLSICISSSAAETIKAKVYPLNSGREHLLFTYQNEITKTQNGRLVSKAQYRDAEGNVDVEELTEMQQGKLKKYQIHQKQLGQTGTIEVKGSRLVFEVEKNGKVRRSTEKATENVVVGPTIVSFLTQNWKALNEEETLTASYALWNRRDTLGFEFRKIRDVVFDNTEAIEVRMSPSSFIVAALVNPIYFVISKESKKLLQLKGRVPPKVRRGSNWEELDAEVYYSYTETPVQAKPELESDPGTQKEAK